MKRFHAHLYFRPDREAEAYALYQIAQARAGIDFEVWKFFNYRVGPHALPMFELHFTEQTEANAMIWLKDHHDPFSVLIHEDTGHDQRDHVEGVRWLGNPLPIGFDFFERVKVNPKLAVHAPGDPNDCKSE